MNATFLLAINDLNALKCVFLLKSNLNLVKTYKGKISK